MTQISRPPQLITELADLRQRIAELRRAGRSIGLVPTMGALHAGHLSLVQAAQAECDATVVSIYVNPTQFGPHEDYTRYPRTLEADRALLAGCGTDLVFVPRDAEMYPAGFATFVEVGAVAEPLEGPCRQGHFRGVATVVLKLFEMVRADVAFFGRKDYQQTLVVRRMAADLNLPVAIRVCPTVREPDGLALSSRNRYLSPAARQRALALWRSLCRAQEMTAAGQRDAATIRTAMAEILRAAGAEIDYVALADPETLAAVERIDRPAIALIAARIDGTRLIDNEILGGKLKAES